MPDLDSKKGEKDVAKGQAVGHDVGLDIENALSFIDSEEYKEAPPPVQQKNPPTPPSRTGKAIHQKDSPARKAGDERVPRHRKIEESPAPKTMTPRNVAKETKRGKMWILWA